MIEDKHRVAALAAIASEPDLFEVLPPEIWAHLKERNLIAHQLKGKRATGLVLTHAGLEFLRRTLT
jgi:hypothetical protein